VAERSSHPLGRVAELHVRHVAQRKAALMEMMANTALALAGCDRSAGCTNDVHYQDCWSSR
jgi:hypothetical protein